MRREKNSEEVKRNLTCEKTKQNKTLPKSEVRPGNHTGAQQLRFFLHHSELHVPEAKLGGGGGVGVGVTRPFPLTLLWPGQRTHTVSQATRAKVGESWPGRSR